MLGVIIFVVYSKERKQTKRAYLYEKRYGAVKMETSQYIDRVKEETTKEVEKLKQSKEYRDYIRERDNPRSFYNRDTEEVSGIVFSDE